METEEQWMYTSLYVETPGSFIVLEGARERVVVRCLQPFPLAWSRTTLQTGGVEPVTLETVCGDAIVDWPLALGTFQPL